MFNKCMQKHDDHRKKIKIEYERKKKMKVPMPQEFETNDTTKPVPKFLKEMDIRRASGVRMETIQYNFLFVRQKLGQSDRKCTTWILEGQGNNHV
jgi:hypothetical protein